MQLQWGLLLVCVLHTVAPVVAQSNPLNKVMELLDNFQKRLQDDKVNEEKHMKAYIKMCGDMAREDTYEDRTLTQSTQKIEAMIVKYTGDVQKYEDHIEALASSTATTSESLTEATANRKEEASDFTEREKELIGVIDSLTRASRFLEKEMQDKPGALVQLTGDNPLTTALDSLSLIVDAAGVSSQDAEQLVALVQSKEDEDGLGAPSASAYESHSGGILDTLENMQDKSQVTLSNLRKTEVETANSFEQMKQAADFKLAALTKEMAQAKAQKAAAIEGKAVAEGDLKVESADLMKQRKTSKLAKIRCMQGAADHAKRDRERAQELKAVGKAREFLSASGKPAAEKTYSFMQIKSSASAGSGTEMKAFASLEHKLKTLARQHHSHAIAQLVQRISSTVRLGATSKDPFNKVLGLIKDMITRLESEASSAASEKAFCDEETQKTTDKKDDLDEDLEKRTVKIETGVTRIAQLKVEIRELEGELSELAAEQEQADQVRGGYHQKYLDDSKDLKEGLLGVKKALQVLRNYYGVGDMQGNKENEGAGSSIIQLLSLLESDFANSLTEKTSQEFLYVSIYTKQTQERRERVALKREDVKYKTGEYRPLVKGIAELKGDRDTMSDEQSAVAEYLGNLNKRCISQPEPYEERVKRRNAELEGLKEALQTLEAEPAFLQRSRKGRHMRGRLQQMAIDDQ